MSKSTLGFYAKNLQRFAFLILLLSLTIDSKKCLDDLSGLDCRCTPLGETKFIEISCQLGEDQSIFDLFQRIAETKNFSIYKLAITSCKTPIDFLKSLPSLKIAGLDISKCGIKKVDEKAFDNLADDLIELGLSNNALTNLPFLGKLKNLEILKLGSNQIKEIPEHSFDGLEKLRSLRLKHNQICSLGPNALSETKNSLELLDLSYNCFTAIPAQSLRSSVELAYLSLEGNQIVDISQMELMNLPKLIDLWLNDNRIAHIAPNAFMNVPNLKHIVLKNNLLTSLETATLQAIRDVQVIDISGNQLSKVPVFKELPNLYDLRLNNNKIKKIEILAFSSIPVLSTINLAGNEIVDISRNSFDQLNSLKTLILSNNSLQTIERYMFDGLQNLDSLLLSNNLIEQLDATSFATLQGLLVLDLSLNKLKKIEKGTFANFHRMNFLDLSKNLIATFEAGSFNNPIGTIVFDGNQLNCDKTFDHFLTYLLRNKVRIFLPSQPDILCKYPEKLEGIRIKDLLMKKANESLQNFSGYGKSNGVSNANLLSQFLPSFGSLDGGVKNNPFLQVLTQAMPSLRNIPVMNTLIPQSSEKVSGAFFDLNNPQLNTALEKFTAPILRFASGNQPLASDVGQLLKSIPELVVNIPGLGDVDVTKLRPDIIEHVLKGGEIPGISRNVLDRIVKQYMERLYYAAAKEQGQSPMDVLTDDSHKSFDSSKYLLPLTELPLNMVTSVISGESLPYLTKEQTQTVKDYYTQQIPLLSGGSGNITELLNPKALQMIKLLPAGYNFSQISPEIIHSVLQGKLPDFRILPADLQNIFIKKVVDKMQNEPNISIHEVLRRLPTFPIVELNTFSPYDINKINAELVGDGNDENGKKALAAIYRNKILTAVALGLVAAATIVVLIAFFVYTKRSRKEAIAKALAADTISSPARFFVS